VEQLIRTLTVSYGDEFDINKPETRADGKQKGQTALFVVLHEAVRRHVSAVQPSLRRCWS
jgi:hypothetical protein